MNRIEQEQQFQKDIEKRLEEIDKEVFIQTSELQVERANLLKDRRKSQKRMAWHKSLIKTRQKLD